MGNVNTGGMLDVQEQQNDTQLAGELNKTVFILQSIAVSGCAGDRLLKTQTNGKEPILTRTDK